MHVKMLSAKMAAILSRGRWVKVSVCASLWQQPQYPLHGIDYKYNEEEVVIT